ncbi:hypothetical protein T492DRAFT_1077353 [Pavlovales sp. CCMP2436]|nr:hypothetical protein T492DRAFT_1077353 [Pavlovales sp. CCMP2436]|eukprot:CAMPEP_0180069032 /NCGR_PEP_ID=MMETSP0985-20121206/10768_1 /TAXON_ID=483367 /ORGANISM="non described non described, Strain CCMP 2436" /LENGTH=74 /DNA_ID=CAMNT_0021999913 /DNA_START=87 /DNA_END=311 /DNA_ORIENTATION=-
MKAPMKLLLLLFVGLATATSSTTKIDGSLVRSSMGPSSAVPFTRLVDVDAALDNADIATDGELTPARGCKGCFG